MGKWTSQHYDDVLGSKIKSLVSGSVRRAKLEDRVGHTISYEKFVEELDAGDSFTTSLVDLLVQEVAIRQTRPTVEDKRLISDSTSRNLRMLASPSRVYRPRPTRVGPPPSSAAALRRSIGLNMTDYLSTLPPDDLNVDEDGDSTDSALDPVGAAEGARLHSEMWDAMDSAPRSSSGPSLLRGSIRRRPEVYPVPAQSTSNSLGLRPLAAEHDFPSLTTHPAARVPPGRMQRPLMRARPLSARREEPEHEHDEPTSSSRGGFPYAFRRYQGWSATDMADDYTGWGTASSIPSVSSPSDEAPPAPSATNDEVLPGLDLAAATSRPSQPRWRHTLEPGETMLPWHTAFESGRRYTAAGGRSSSTTREGSGWARADESW